MHPVAWVHMLVLCKDSKVLALGTTPSSTHTHPFLPLPSIPNPDPPLSVQDSQSAIGGERAAAIGDRSSWSSPTGGCGLDSPTSSRSTATGERRCLGGAAPRAEKAPPPPLPLPRHRSASDCSRLTASRPRTERVAPASLHRSRLAFAVAAIAPSLVVLVSRLALRRLRPMAPQRRGPPRVPEGNSAAERRHANR